MLTTLKSHKSPVWCWEVAKTDWFVCNCRWSEEILHCKEDIKQGTGGMLQCWDHSFHSKIKINQGQMRTSHNIYLEILTSRMRAALAKTFTTKWKPRGRTHPQSIPDQGFMSCWTKILFPKKKETLLLHGLAALRKKSQAAKQIWVQLSKHKMQ